MGVANGCGRLQLSELVLEIALSVNPGQSRQQDGNKRDAEHRPLVFEGENQDQQVQTPNSVVPLDSLQSLKVLKENVNSEFSAILRYGIMMTMCLGQQEEHFT